MYIYISNLHEMIQWNGISRTGSTVETCTTAVLYAFGGILEKNICCLSFFCVYYSLAAQRAGQSISIYRVRDIWKYIF